MFVLEICRLLIKMKILKRNKIRTLFIKKHLIQGAFFVVIDCNGQGSCKPNITQQQPQPRKYKLQVLKNDSVLLIFNTLSVSLTH